MVNYPDIEAKYDRMLNTAIRGGYPSEYIAVEIAAAGTYINICTVPIGVWRVITSVCAWSANTIKPRVAVIRAGIIYTVAVGVHWSNGQYTVCADTPFTLQGGDILRFIDDSAVANSGKYCVVGYIDVPIHSAGAIQKATRRG